MSKQALIQILELAAHNPPPIHTRAETMRNWAESVTALLPLAERVRIERIDCGPLGGDLITPARGDRTRLIIFYHGGGFLFGSSRTHRVIASNLARAADCAVLAPDYRLAPENRAPAAHDDAFAIYRWALERGYAPQKIALCGDSAGGNLSLASALRARAQTLPLPCALALMSPWLDFAEEGASYRDTPNDPILAGGALEYFRRAYLGDGDRRSSAVTPLYADFHGLPPTLVHVGSWEMLRDDAITVVKRLQAAGVAAKLEIFDGMCHSWQMYAPLLEEGMESIEGCAHFLRLHQA